MLPSHEDDMPPIPPGPIVPEASPPLPGFACHAGKAVPLEPLSIRHVDDLWEAAHAADVSWAYLKYGPFSTKDAMAVHVARQRFFAVIPAFGGKAEGWAPFCDVASGDAAIEVGSIWLSSRPQRTRAATEAVFLMMRHAFAIGYDRAVGAAMR